MGASNQTIDGNGVGLAYCEEVLGAPGTVSSPTWYPIEPNSYSDFGPQNKLTERAPISASRQRRKGVVTDVDATAGFQIDFTSKDLYRLMQGFMFASWSEKTNLLPSAVSATLYTVPSGGAGFLVNSLLFGEGFAITGNNGLKVVTASAGTTVTAAGLAIETPPAGATITRVGHQGASGDLTMTVVSSRPQLNSTALNFTTLGLVAGEWLFIGGDAAGLQFATAICNGFYRIFSIAANVIIFDRWPSVATADTGTGKTIQLFFGHLIKNQSAAANQVFRTYQFERTLNATNFEYVTGCGANTLTINVTQGDKVTVDLGFVALTGTRQGSAKAGTRAALPGQAAFNASSSFSRLQFYNDTGAASLASYMTDLKLMIDNGITTAKAIGVTGGFDLTAGTFKVSGSLDAYFAAIAAVDAVNSNVDAALNFAMVDNYGGFGTGWVFDVPLVALGDGRIKVEKDKPVKLPVTLDAAGHATLDYTLLAQRFAYLPQLAN